MKKNEENMEKSSEYVEINGKKVVCASLFQDRHLFPECVKSAVYDYKFAPNPLDIYELTRDAMNKLEEWKSNGVDGVYLYLSGLTSGTLAVLNAAYALDMYIKVFHFSFLTDQWVPQTLEWCYGMPGFDNGMNAEERRLLTEEYELRKDLTQNEYRTFVKYMRAFQEAKLRKSKGETWGSIKDSLVSHMKLEPRIVEIMPRYFPENIHTRYRKEGDSDDRGENDKFHIRLRERLIESRPADEFPDTERDPWKAIDDRIFRRLRPDSPRDIRERARIYGQ